ncbi:hypothetical protein [Afipia clevelandensis]|uniref:Uncharacterized protein n=1 Tax=Afipia clevelandensis ATCC 49720 TaxID=883079 RepID=K8P6V4_9BRAD|nr:hypothetical protein [Afipia clevelandensis]EKS35365.1 hypothetical protein HMPREF9696_02637 [Afipia clevelandensis ATCC 49720]
MTLAAPKADQWNHLPDIHDVPPLSGHDEACLTAVREVLARHGCLERFGLTLLHKHFGMSDDEVLVEAVDEQSRTLVTKPVRIADLSGRLDDSTATQWHWKRDPDGAYEQICVSRCFPGNWQSPGHSNQHTGW